MTCSSRPKCLDTEKTFFRDIIDEIEALKGTTSDGSNCAGFGMGLNEKFIDLDEMAGVIIGRYLILKIDQSSRNPLYDEPINDAYHEEVQYGFELEFFYAFLNTEVDVDGAGKRTQKATRIKIIRDTWNEKMIELSLVNTYPKIGDVVKINNNYFNVVDVGKDKDTGITSDTFNLELIKRSKFVPERKLNT